MKPVKPVRGSARIPSKAPKGRKRSSGTSQHTVELQEREAEPRSADENTQLNPLKKTKVAGASSTSGKVKGPRKVRGQDKWMPMPKSSITALQNVLDLSILSMLVLKQKHKQETQKHLNILKDGFLAECAQLKVPVQRLKDAAYSSGQHQEETRKSLVVQKTLRKLVEDKEATVSALWTAEEQMTSLDDKCKKLRDDLEEEEEKANDILQITERGVLSLPPLPPRKDGEPTLQDQMMRMVPKEASQATARRLVEALKKSASIRDAHAVLLTAEKYVDQL